MPDVKTQIQAINDLGSMALVSIASLGLLTLLIAYTPTKNSSRYTLIGAFAMWIIVGYLLVFFTFSPAIRAMQLVKSSFLFVSIAIVAAGLLFSLRLFRKDVYGLIEVAVAISTLIFLGQEFDSKGEISTIIGFVGAVYVLIRGLTNMVETWFPSLKR